MGISIILTQNGIDLLFRLWGFSEKSRASRSWAAEGRRFGDQIATKIYVYPNIQIYKFPQFRRNPISGSPSNFFMQKNTLSHFTKTKHFYKTQKTQILRKNCKYQNKIDIYFVFHNKKQKYNETRSRIGLKYKTPENTKIKLWEYR